MVIVMDGGKMEQVDLKSQIKEVLKKNLNLAGLISDSIDGIAEPALRAAIAATDTKVDDIVLAALYQPLEDELKKIIVAQLDWDKLLGGAANSGEPV